MVKRSRLRRNNRGVGRKFLVFILAGSAILLSLRFFWDTERSNDKKAIHFTADVNTSLLDDRGTIYDRNYKRLAVTLEKVSIYADVRDVDVGQVVTQLSPILDIEEDMLQETIEKEPFRAWLAKNISQNQEEQVAELELEGVYFHKERARYYPQQSSTAHVVGYVGKSMGLAGVEYTYNSLLNRYGSALIDDGAKEIESGSAAQDNHIVLTLDLKIQKIVESMLAEVRKNNEEIKVAALLMESETGKVISAAQSPSYDPNLFETARDNELENLLMQTIPVPAAMRKLFWDASLIQLQDEKDEMLSWSAAGEKRMLGSQLRLWDRIGLNDPLEVDFIKPETRALDNSMFTSVERSENLFDSVPSVSTPLQIASSLNALVNGGMYIQPFVIEKITGKDEKTYILNTSSGSRAVSSAVSEEIRRLISTQLREAPLGAGIFESDSISYSAYPDKNHYTSNTIVVTFIPANKPKLMLFVFANLPPFSPSPSKTKSRFFFTEPISSKIASIMTLQEVMSNLSDMMTAEEKREMNFQLSKSINQGFVLSTSEKDDVQKTMPDVKGMSLRRSLRELKDLKLEIQISGTGVVVEQFPAAGNRVKTGELCRLVLKPH